MDEILTIKDEGVLVPAYREYIKIYRPRLPELFEWLVTLSTDQLLQLRLEHQAKNDKYHERILVDTRNISRYGDSSVLMFKNINSAIPLYRFIERVSGD